MKLSQAPAPLFRLLVVFAKSLIKRKKKNAKGLEHASAYLAIPKKMPL
jgi:hypothetical protein